MRSLITKNRGLAVLLGVALVAWITEGVSASPRKIVVSTLVPSTPAESVSSLLVGQLILALLMLLACILVHIILTWTIFYLVRHPGILAGIRRFAHRRILFLALVVITLFVGMLFEIVLWGILYLKINALGGVEEALYYSLVTYSSLGYGDITLEAQFRLLGAIQSLVGVVMIGWSTALLVGILQKLIDLKDAKRAAR